MHRPERTCVGCRTRGPKSELLRLVKAHELSAATVVVVDLPQVAPGRGAYVHRRQECLDLALRRRALGRALRSPSPDAEQVVQAVQPHLGVVGGVA